MGEGRTGAEAAGWGGGRRLPMTESGVRIDLALMWVGRAAVSVGEEGQLGVGVLDETKLVAMAKEAIVRAPLTPPSSSPPSPLHVRSSAP